MVAPAYIRFTVKSHGDLPEVRALMEYAVIEARVRTKLYGVRDSDDGIKTTKDSAFLTFPYGSLKADELGRLLRALTRSFDNCTMKKIYSIS